MTQSDLKRRCLKVKSNLQTEEEKAGEHLAITAMTLKWLVAN